MIRFRRKLGALVIVSILVLSVCLTLLLGINVSASSESEARAKSLGTEYVSSFSSEARDENNDTSYDILLISITLNITSSDFYFVNALMKPMGLHAKDYFKGTLDIGEHEISLPFDGADIYETGRDGPYTIEISVYKGNGELLVEIEYATVYYDHQSFNPTPATGWTGMESITVVNNTIKLKTTTFVAVIYELRPMIEFFYTSDDGRTAKFKITYEDVIGFNDLNDDDKFQDNELKYWGDLFNSHWNSPKLLMEDFDNFDFQVQTIVDIMDENSDPTTTKIELVFHYSSLTKMEDIETARKFDISFRVLGTPLTGITHLALKHTLSNELGNHEFLPGEKKISFVTNDRKERGYYSWKEHVEVTTSNGDTANKAVKFNLEPGRDSSEKALYLNYPYSMDTAELYHDPVVGVNPENPPELPAPNAPDIIKHNQWLIIYIFVAIIVGCIMAGNIHYQRKKRKKK